MIDQIVIRSVRVQSHDGQKHISDLIQLLYGNTDVQRGIGIVATQRIGNISRFAHRRHIEVMGACIDFLRRIVQREGMDLGAKIEIDRKFCSRIGRGHKFEQSAHVRL